MSCGSMTAQVHPNAGQVLKITYERSFNGNIIENQDPILAFVQKSGTLITTKKQMSGEASIPYEFSYIHSKTGMYRQVAILSDDSVVSMVDTISKSAIQFDLTNETKEILGYLCKKAVTSINSNSIEIWYYDEGELAGGPLITGASLGLVLEYSRNGNYLITASKAEDLTWETPDFLTKLEPELLPEIDYRDKIWKSRFTTLPVFDDQLIHWSDEYTPRKDVFRFANGTIAVKKVKFPKISPSSLIFLDLKEQSNGDAYDRTGTVFMIPTDKEVSFWDGLQNGANSLPLYENGNGKKYQGVVATENYDPLIELMRFFTPFGVHHFNGRVTLKDKLWHDAVHYRQEVTFLASILSGQEVYVGVFIGNYDKGGHKIDMNFTIHNEDDITHHTQKVIPLFNTVNVMEMAGQEYGTMFDSDQGLTLDFSLDKPLKNVKLRYITTGHGGWGNGDEFVPKKNTIVLDKNTVFDLTPWREDCGSYRLYNPVSGNFSNGLSSSDYSRSNWCPGTVTNPYIIDVGDLDSGSHTIRVTIPQGQPEGNSFSAWNVSGVLIGDVE